MVKALCNVYIPRIQVYAVQGVMSQGFKQYLEIFEMLVVLSANFGPARSKKGACKKMDGVQPYHAHMLRCVQETGVIASVDAPFGLDTLVRLEGGTVIQEVSRYTTKFEMVVVLAAPFIL